MVELATLILVLALSSLIYMFIPPLLDGIERKIKADIQSRVGPPTVLQTWYDILKLFSKEMISQSKPTFFIFALSASLTLLLILSLILTYIIVNPNNTLLEFGTTRTSFLLLSLILVLIISIHAINSLIYTVSSNPFSIIGVFRALTVDLMNEAMFVSFLVIMFSLVINRNSVSIIQLFSHKRTIPLIIVSYIPLVLSTYISSRRLPYDLHEAEPELASGSIIELSGPALGLYIYNHLIERYIVTSIPVTMLILALMGCLNPLLCVLILHLGTSILYLFFGLISFTVGRSRIDMAFKTISLLYIFAILVWIGVYIFEYIYR
ncbi:MAG: NADH-quinone oxidoreductase subunit H [Desulfurococcaceae archaeon]